MGDEGTRSTLVRGDDRAVSDARLFEPAEREELEQRWNAIQSAFVDEPRSSVQRANALVEDLMNRLVSRFSTERGRLEEQWDRGDDVTTEELRLALQRYRSFFSRLLKVEAGD